ATPAARAGTIRWTRTDIVRPAAGPSGPRRSTYAATRSPESDSQQTAIASASASSPRTSRTVSNWPAKLASVPSSADAEERTATGVSDPIRRKASRASETARSPLPIRLNPSGTCSPRRISSPSRAALPPTSRWPPASDSGTIRISTSLSGLIVVCIALLPSRQAGRSRARQRIRHIRDLGLEQERLAAVLTSQIRLEHAQAAVGERCAHLFASPGGHGRSDQVMEEKGELLFRQLGVAADESQLLEPDTLLQDRPSRLGRLGLRGRVHGLTVDDLRPQDTQLLQPRHLLRGH